MDGGMPRAPIRERTLRLALLAGSLVAISSALAILEGALRITDPGLMVRQRGLQRYHPRLGWENRPGARSAAAGVEVTIDRHGRRATGQTGSAASTDAHVLLLGDSVAFGLGVSDDETFAASLTQGSNPYRVTNLAVPGYGPDQSLLRYEREGVAVGASVVILALCLGNDLADVVSPHHLYDERLPNPRFVLRGGDLQLEDDHVGGHRLRMLLDRSFLLARLSPSVRTSGPDHEQTARRLEALRAHSEEAEETLVAIVRRLRSEVERRGSRFVVAAFPDFRTLDQKSVRWPSLREKLSPHVDLLDLTPILARDHETYSRNTLDKIGHLSKQGHEHAARAIRTHLSRDTNAP